MTGGNRVVRARVQMMESWGEEGVLQRFLDAGSIRQFCIRYFEVHSDQEDAIPGTSAFYAWLEDGGEARKAWWRGVRAMRAADHADKAQWRLDTANEDNYRLRSEQAKQDRWMASVLDRETYGNGPQVTIQNNTLQVFGEQLAGALKEIEERRALPVVEAEVVSLDGEGQ